MIDDLNAIKTDKYLHKVREFSSSPNWKPFAKLVDVLVCLEEEGYKLSDAKSRSNNTYPFEIQARVFNAKKKYLRRNKKNIELLSLGTPFELLPIVMDGLNTMLIYNKYSLYHGEKKGKIDLNYYEDLVFKHGIKSHLINYQETGFVDSLKFAHGCSVIVGRNFEKALINVLGVKPYEAKTLSKKNPFYNEELITI